ncbi:MAG: NFACT family protein [Eubacterium sp.]|nr:NFACT family protein [Eubacterium sp.]
MAFDGFMVRAIRQELAEKLTGGRLAKIIQPEADALLLTIKNQSETFRLAISASPSLPLIYLTNENQPAPAAAPNFCMLLRKHIGGGRILSVSQPGLERILSFEIEHRNELGDLVTRFLRVELMGKYSNIIFTDPDNVIIDAIRRVPFHVSSVREVLPGRTWFIPDTQNKLNPAGASEEDLGKAVFSKPAPLAKAIYTSLTGFSPQAAEEVCFRASIDGGAAAESLTEPEKLHLIHTLHLFLEDAADGIFSPCIYYRGAVPEAYAPFELRHRIEDRCVPYDSVSRLLVTFYAEKEKQTRIRQKSTDLRHITGTLLERASKKLSLQQKQMQDTEKRETFRIYGELLNTYGYSAEEGARSLDALNYYTGETITIPLDPQLSAGENAKHYFARYTKLKRTAADLECRLVQTREEVSHLESIRTSLDLAETEADLQQIRDELETYGYVRRKHTGGKQSKKKTAAAPVLHYRTRTGYDIYVGKNNYQNEQVSFQIASGNDWWFHAKNMPGSHVIVKSGGRELPDSVFEDAGRLAAWYSKGRQAPKVEIDYTERKNLRKPGGAKPGFVVYYTNYSLMAPPDISGLELVTD